MDSAKRARAEAWLKYGNDLGLGPYFRNRTPLDASPAVESTLTPSFEMAARTKSAANSRSAPAAAPSPKASSAPSSWSARHFR